MKLIDLLEATADWKEYADHPNFPEGTTAKDYNWQHIPKFMLSNLLTIMPADDWIRWFKAEQEGAAEDGREDFYDDMLREPIHDPVVLIKIGKKYDVVDGWHRIGASFVTKRKAIPAVVGVPKEAPKQETVGSNAGEEHSEDDNPRPPPIARGEEGNAQWDWTDPYHQSGEQNAVMHRMQ